MPERERGSILLTVDLVDHTSHDSPLYHHMNHIPFQQWSPPFPGLAPAETGAAKSLAPWSPAWAAFAGGTWKGTGLRDWDFLWRTGWLVGGLCFFCFLMLCNVFHPTSDDYLNSLIDTHSHVYTYTYIYIYIYHFMYTYQYKQYIDLNIYIYIHIFYTVSVRVCLTPSRKGPQKLVHCVQSDHQGQPSRG
jgi:hypothetical protein